jgi:hypothetical protein
MRREFVRHVMNLRKQAGLRPGERVHIAYRIESTEALEAVRTKRQEVMDDVSAESLEPAEKTPETARAASEVKLDGQPCRLWIID